MNCIECVRLHKPSKTRVQAYTIRGWAAPVPLCDEHALDGTSESTDMRKGDLPQASPLDFHKQVDEIIFRCFAQGQYWGTEKDGELDPDYKPENPIDRGEAVAAITALVQTLVPEEIGRERDKNDPEEMMDYQYYRGFNACRDIILSTIKGVKADE